MCSQFYISFISSHWVPHAFTYLKVEKAYKRSLFRLIFRQTEAHLCYLTVCLDKFQFISIDKRGSISNVHPFIPVLIKLLNKVATSLRLYAKYAFHFFQEHLHVQTSLVRDPHHVSPIAKLDKHLYKICTNEQQFCSTTTNNMRL